MPLEVKQEGREPARKLIRRFSQRMRRSGILRRAREIKFFKRPLSKSQKKVAALRRIRIRENSAKRPNLTDQKPINRSFIVLSGLEEKIKDDLKSALKK
jgi:ribosomal protein S21